MDDPRTADLTKLRLLRAAAESEVEENRARTGATIMFAMGGAAFVAAGVLLLIWLGVSSPLVVIVPALLYGAACFALGTQIERAGKAVSADLLQASRALVRAEGDVLSQAEAPDGL